MSNKNTVSVEIQEFRKLQEGVQTPGPKCNRDFYDIIWDREYAESIYGPDKNKPFEMSKPTLHICPKDSQNNYITRKGYTKDNMTGKVIWIGTTGSPPPHPPPPPQHQTQSPLAVPPDISAQIGGLTNSVKQLAAAYEAVAMKQNEEIQRLRILVDEFIRHNPLESSFLELTKRMMAYLPEAELGPRTADQYKVGFESAQ